LEWLREDQRLDAVLRGKAVAELVGLVRAVGGIAPMQAEVDAECFVLGFGPAAGRSSLPDRYLNVRFDEGESAYRIINPPARTTP
jgi:hypothetical protein